MLNNNFLWRSEILKHPFLFQHCYCHQSAQDACPQTIKNDCTVFKKNVPALKKNLDRLERYRLSYINNITGNKLIETKIML